MLSADLGLPDIGLTTLTEVAHRGSQITRMTDLPAIIDADTGFGEPMNVARTIQALEDAGVAGLHIEDQVNPKRCGHLDGKAIVDTETATKRIRAAVSAIRKAVDVPVLANMTEFGKSELFTTEQLESVGINIVIYPVSLLRLAMGAAERGLDTLLSAGTLEPVVSEMQTRARLYELLDYEAYNTFDSGVFNFTLETNKD